MKHVHRCIDCSLPPLYDVISAVWIYHNQVLRYDSIGREMTYLCCLFALSCPPSTRDMFSSWLTVAPSSGWYENNGSSFRYTCTIDGTNVKTATLIRYNPGILICKTVVFFFHMMMFGAALMIWASHGIQPSFTSCPLVHRNLYVYLAHITQHYSQRQSHKIKLLTHAG